MALTQEQVEQLKQQLLRRRHELWNAIRNELSRAGHESLAGQVHDRGEESLADLLVGLDVAIAGLDMQELEDISTALAQIDAGNYGICVDCGVDIPLARLESRPAAIRCVDCQEMSEAQAGTPR